MAAAYTESWGVGLLNRIASLASVASTTGISFGAASGLALDVYRPRAARSELPTVVFFYGGGWDSGRREMYRFAGTALAARGFAVVIPDYRVYPEARFPTFLEDAAQAVRWTIDNVATHGGDPRRLVLAGHSAGAHIAAMLGFDRQWLGRVGLDAATALRGVAGLAGPYDFLPLHSPTLKAIFGPEAGLAATQPINFIDRRVVPTFLAAGRGDRTVDPANSVRLAARIRAQGGRARLKLYPHVGHALLIGAFSPMLRPFAPVLDDVADFAGEVADADVTSQTPEQLPETVA